MPFLIISIICACIIVIFLWVIGFYLVNDLSVISKEIPQNKKILFIYPHADDECSGFIHILSKFENKTLLVLLTKGERGTPDGHREDMLKEIRAREAEKMKKIYHLTKLIQEDFGDGKLLQKRNELSIYLSKLIHEENPDIIITYDLAGSYGHPDHIIISEIITNIVKKQYKKIHLWYGTFPKKIYNMGNFPVSMAKDPLFLNKRAYPTHKIYIGFSIIQKIQAIYTYRSQFDSFRKAVPYPFIPLWFIYSFMVYEYFHEVK